MDAITLLKCQFCNKNFTNISSFNHHQKTAKYCLKIQNDIKSVEIKCQYCNKIFSKQSNLNQHQKTTKYCYNMMTDQTRDIISFECDGCKKTLTSKLNFERHIASCILLKDKQYRLSHQTLLEEKNKIEQKLFEEKIESQSEINELKKQLENSRLDMIAVTTKLKEVEKQLDKQERLNKHLQDSLLEKATSKTNTTNTTNIDLKLFISEEVVRQKIQNKFTKNHLINGYNGIANFIKSEIATNEEGKLLYTCSDPSRQIFNYTDEKGNEVKDVKGVKMLSLVKPKLIEKTSQIQAKEQDEYNYLRKRYNGDDEIPNEDVQRRMNQHKFYSEIANDMIVNKIGDDKFPTKMSSELVKVLC